MPGSSIPRPESQPKSFASVPPPRPMDMGRPVQGENFIRREEEYNPERPGRPIKYDDPRYMSERERQEREMDMMREREMQEREREFREREFRERALSGGDPNRQHAMMQDHYMQQMGPRGPQPAFGRQPDPREQGAWRQQQQYEPARAPYDPAAAFPRHHEYPPSSGPHYGLYPAYSQQPAERYPPSSGPPHHLGHHQGGPPPPYVYDSSPERQRSGPQHVPLDQPPQMQRSRTLEEGHVPPPSVAYNAGGGPSLFEGQRNRSMDDVNQPPHNQRSLLQVHEINRKGRISPLPQAVQGAQPQLSGPAGEPGIKSEFGRIFAGISGGIGGISSPAPTRTALPFSGPGMLRRDDSDIPQQEAGPEPATKPGARGKRSRKPKDDDGNGEDSGRASPAGRNKRAKNHAHHHHQYVQHHSLSNIPVADRHSHHHHHHHHAQEQLSPPPGTASAPFKNAKEMMPSPTGGLVRDLHTAHHHQVAPRSTPGNHAQASNTKAVAPAPQPMIIPKPKKIVASNEAVLDSVANLPRHHLGDVPYEVKLKPARLQDPRTGRPPRYGYQSTPVPLPWELVRDKMNCTLTVKVGKQHLVPAAREEITSRRALWGTDIYTDDSDIVAACIHGGWIRGEWPEDVDVDMLDLYATDEKDRKGGKKSGAAGSTTAQADSTVALDAPPRGGPQNVPEHQDLHVTVLVLPALEKYASSCRFGIKSREFGGDVASAGGVPGLPPHRAKHDGLSFMITGLRWVNNGAGTQNRLRGKARRERIRRALREVELGPVWAAKSLNVDAGRAAAAEAAAERAAVAAPPIDGDVEMTGNWWKHRGTPPSEGDKENLPAAAGIVTDRQEEAAKKNAVDDEPVKESAATEEPEAAKEAAASEEEAGPAKEVDPDETMGEDTIVGDDQKDDDDREEGRQGGEEARKTGEEEEPAKPGEDSGDVNGEKAAGPTPDAARQAGQDDEASDKPAGKADVAMEDAEPATEPSGEAVAEVVAEVAKEPVAEPGKEATKEPVAELARDSAEEPTTQAEPSTAA